MEQVEPTPKANHTVVNPLMVKIKMPGVTVKLPSGGLLYGNHDELSPRVTHGEIHVYPMTAIDEITMKSPDKMISGDSVREVFAHCIPDITNIDQIFAKDIDYLMLILRKVSYGDTLLVEYTHDCEGAKNHEYVVNLNTLVAQSRSIDPVTLNDKFTITLPNSQKVYLTPMRFGDIINIMQSAATDEEQDKHRKLFGVILSLIDNVDGVSDKNHILEWLSSMPVAYVNTILKEVETLSKWGPDYDYTVECQDCKKSTIISVPINPFSFFT